MTDAELADRLSLEGSRRTAFIARLENVRKGWAWIKNGTPPDNKMLKRRLEQYYSTVEKLSKIVSGLPEYLTEIEPDPNAGNNTTLDAWMQHPPHPIDYLDLILKDRWDVGAMLAQREQDPDAVVYRDLSDQLIKMPRSDTHRRDLLINWLVDLFLIAYPDAEPKIYNLPDGGVAGGFADFLREVMASIDPESVEVETLLERARRRL